MKITQKWKRNTPDTLTGESITVTITYSSLDKKKIDDLEKRLPDGITIGETSEIGIVDYREMLQEMHDFR